jgi:hypothetical protein
MASRNSPLTAKSCACMYITILAGIFSWYADSSCSARVALCAHPTRTKDKTGKFPTPNRNETQLKKLPIFISIQDNFFPPNSSSKKLRSYNNVHISNRANVSVINDTVNILLGWVIQLFHCITYFCFITYHTASCMATSVNRRMLIFIVVLCSVSGLGSK